MITRAGMWKVPHNTREDEVHLKIGRYHKPKEWFESEVAELDKPKSELTLTGDEFVNLISFIQDNYEPFKNGTKAFIPLDNPYDQSVAHQVKQLLNLDDRERMLNFLIDNEVIPSD
ncbi:hypothetical protein VC87395_003683, partial [Vibrio paracholerae 87395]